MEDKLAKSYEDALEILGNKSATDLEKLPESFEKTLEIINKAGGEDLKKLYCALKEGEHLYNYNKDLYNDSPNVDPYNEGEKRKR